MQGVLFKYGPASSQIAFKSQRSGNFSNAALSRHRSYLVLVGGLTDGLLFAPYCQQLAETSGWTVVHAQLTSSYQGWGLASLDQDAAELKLLSECLAADHGCTSWVLMGHSTGCQAAVRYVQQYRASDDRLAGVILQAPVSDREYFGSLPSWSEHITAAQQLVAQGKEEQVVCRASDWDGAAVTARRLVSLACAGGDDDMFSTDLSLQQLRVILGPLQGLPTLLIQSGADEAVPQHLRDNGSMRAAGQRMRQAIIQGPNLANTDVHTPAIPEDSTAWKAADQLQLETSKGLPSTAEAEAEGSVEQQEAAKLVQLHVIRGAGHACKGHEQQLAKLVSIFLQLLPNGGRAAIPMHQ